MQEKKWRQLDSSREGLKMQNIQKNQTVARNSQEPYFKHSAIHYNYNLMK